MKFIRTLVIGLLAAVTVGAFAACRHSPEERVEKVSKRISKELDLTPAQKTELDKLTQIALADFATVKGDRKSILDEVEKQVVSDKIDPAQMKKLAQDQMAKRQALTDKWIGLIADFHSKLTPEQKQKALKGIQKFRSFADR